MAIIKPFQIWLWLFRLPFFSNSQFDACYHTTLYVAWHFVPVICNPSLELSLETMFQLSKAGQYSHCKLLCQEILHLSKNQHKRCFASNFLSDLLSFFQQFYLNTWDRFFSGIHHALLLAWWRLQFNWLRYNRYKICDQVYFCTHLLLGYSEMQVNLQNYFVTKVWLKHT